MRRRLSCVCTIARSAAARALARRTHLCLMYAAGGMRCRLTDWKSSVALYSIAAPTLRPVDSISRLNMTAGRQQQRVAAQQQQVQRSSTGGSSARAAAAQQAGARAGQSQHAIVQLLLHARPAACCTAQRRWRRLAESIYLFF